MNGESPLSVTELTNRIKGVIEPSFGSVWVKGEISNYRPAASGHAYFSLKDNGSCISVAIFGWNSRNKRNSTQAFELKDGLDVVCRGRVSVYVPRGGYQLLVDQIEPLGAGALQAAFEQLKAKLLAEGLFDQSKKRAIPKFPKTIAVVTSPSGAAIRDMLNILNRRAPNIRVLIVPAVVQGVEAPKQLVRGIDVVNKHSLADLIVVTRGGGSIEDLWCFNDEDLARCISKSRLPIISAVGHEIDFTISDFVADLRAPTPSAAAEIISGFWLDSFRSVQDSRERVVRSTLRDIVNRKNLLRHLSARLISPRDRLRDQVQRCDELYMQLERAVKLRIEAARTQLEKFAAKLDALSPLKVLERGYSLVRSLEDGEKIVRSAKEIRPGQNLRIRFYDGEKTVKAIQE